MQALSNTAVVITDGDLIYYYTSFYADDAYLAILGDKRYLFTDMRYYSAAKLQAKAEIMLLAENSLFKFLADNSVKEIELVYDYSSSATYDKFLKLGYKISDCTAKHFEKAIVKREDELLNVKTACEIADRAFQKTLPSIRAGVTELELAAELEYNFKLLGASGPSFETIVAFNEGSSVPHYKTSNKKLLKNSVILMDFGCKYNGYCSDMTRVIYYGEPTERFLSVYSAVKKANELAFNKVGCGVRSSEVDKVARDYLATLSLDKNFTHSLGHGIGVKIHEEPRLSSKSNAVLKEGMVFSIEPGVYLENEFGIRLENTVAIINGKAVSFMKTDIEPIIIR